MSEQLNQYIGVPDQLTEEQERGFTDTLISGSLGALSSVGNILDLPGSSVRDILAWENPFDQWMPGNWTTHENRVTGRELLTKWGMRENVESGMGGWVDDPGEGARDLSGFGAEVLLDPLTWTGFGAVFPFIKGGLASLKPAGMAVRKAGLLDDAADVLKRLKVSKYDEDIASSKIPIDTEDMLSAADIDRKFATGIREARAKITPKMMIDDPVLVQRYGGRDTLARKIEEKLFTKEQVKVIDDLAEGVSDKISGMPQAELVAYATKVVGKDMAERSVDDIAYELKRALLPDDIKQLLDSNLGGSLRLSVPFSRMQKVWSPFGGKVSHSVDRFDRWIASTPPGVWTGTAFDYAARGQLGRVGQAVARLSTRLTDVGSQGAAEALSEIGKSTDVIRGILLEHAKNSKTGMVRGVLELLGRKGKAISGATKKGAKEPELYHTGDFVKNKYGVAEIQERGVYGKARGIEGTDGVWVRQYSKSQNEYIQRHMSFAELLESKRLVNSPVGWAEDTLEQALMTFMRGAKEEGFDAALNNIRVRDFYDVNSGEATFKELLENAGAYKSRDPGAIGKAPSKLEDSIRESLDSMTKYENLVRDRMAAKGFDIGHIIREEFFYAPRDLTRRMGRVAEQVAGESSRGITRESRLFGKDKLSVSDEVTDSIKEQLIREAAREGRDPGVAYLPAYVVERILSDKVLQVGSDSLRELGQAPSIRSHLQKEYGEWLKKASNKKGLGAQGRSELHEAQLDLLEDFVGNYRGDVGLRGPMYIRDLMHSYKNYFHQLNNMEALHDAGLMAMADSVTSLARSGSDGTTVPLRTVFERLGHNAEDGFGTSLEHISKLLSDNTKRLLGDSNQLDNFRVSKELADSLAVTKKIIEKGPFRKAFENFIDRFTASFKGNVTLPFPSFANRNFFSGQFVNITSGDVATLSDFILYMKHFWRAKKLGANPASDTRLVQEIRELEFVGNQHFDDVDFVGKRESPFIGSVTKRDTPRPILGRDGMWGKMALIDNWDEAEEFFAANPTLWDALGGGSKPLTESAKTAKLKWLKKAHRNVLTQGSNYNQIIEWQNRVPMYLYLKDKGFSAAEAARRVRELQFDYSRLTDIERGVMRRAIPFYAFTRKMSPLFFTTLLDRPGGGLGQFIRATRHGATSDEVLPPYVSQKTSLPLGVDPGSGAKSFVSKFGLAHEDPISYFSHIGQGIGPGLTGFGMNLLGRSNPLGKVFFELGTGKSTFQLDDRGRGRDIERLNPAVSQTKKNIFDTIGSRFTPIPHQTENPDPAFSNLFGNTFETVASNTPASRGLSELRRLFDRRKIPDWGEQRAEGEEGNTTRENLERLLQMGVSTMLGPGITTLSPYQMRSARAKAIESLLQQQNIPVSPFTSKNPDKLKLVQQMQRDRIQGGTPLDRLPSKYSDAAYSIYELNKLRKESRPYSKQRREERFRKLGI